MNQYLAHEIVSVNEMPSDNEIRNLCKKYFDAQAEKYDDHDLRSEKRRLYHDGIDTYAVRRLAELDQCNVVLSFGCGTGRREQKITAQLTKRPVIIGIEHSPQMAAKAASRRINVRPDMIGLNAPEQSSVDAVLCLFSFDHLPSVETRLETLRKFASVLRPSGVLIMDVFNLQDKFEWGPQLSVSTSSNQLFSGKSGPGNAFYKQVGAKELSFLHYFTVSEITGLIEASGLIITDLVGVGYAINSGKIGVPFDEGALLLTCVKPSKA